MVLRITLTLVISSFSSAAFAEREPANAPRPRARKVSTAELVRRLSHAEYAVRQQATADLKKRGAEAIPLLIQAAQKQPLEAAARALSILEEFYTDLELDDATLEKVESALEGLRGKGNGAIGELAGDVLTRHSGIREKRALAAVVKLGGIVKYMPATYTPNGNGVVDPNGERQINFILIGAKWKGGDEGLKYLQRITNLKMLYVARNKKFSPVSKKALDQLAAGMANLQIQERGLACLGVRGYPNAIAGRPGCYINSVEAGSAAANGGIRAGDFVTSFGGKKVADFQALVELIAGYSPGDKVQVQIARGGLQLTKTVELQGWKP